MTRDRCIGWIYVNNLLSVGVHLPDDFLYVVGYAAKAILALAQGSFSFRAFRRITEDEEVTSGDIVRRRSEIDEDRVPVTNDQFGSIAVPRPLQEAFPFLSKIVAFRQ